MLNPETKALVRATLFGLANQISGMRESKKTFERQNNDGLHAFCKVKVSARRVRFCRHGERSATRVGYILRVEVVGGPGVGQGDIDLTISRVLIPGEFSSLKAIRYVDRKIKELFS